MPVREGGSYILDPVTGALRPNTPAEPATTDNPAKSETGPDGNAPVGAQVPLTEAATEPVDDAEATTRRVKPSKET